LLEVFRDLAIRRASDADLNEFIIELSKSLPAGWKRDKKREKTLGQLTLSYPQFSFAIAARQEYPAAHLFLMQQNNAFEITNIVPDKLGELGRKQYNAYVEEFRSICEPIAARLGLQVDMTSDQLNLSELLTPRAMSALETFSDNANMGSLHPLDDERWRRFLILSHQDHVKLDTQILFRWLHEVWHWPEDKAHDLSSQYEFAQELLDDYDKGRR
jgi:hypothetical protein